MNQTYHRLTSFLAPHDITLHGSAPSVSLETAPPGYRPSDLLPDAQSLFALGVPVPRGVFRAGERSLATYWRTVNVLYRNLDALVGRCAAIMEQTGELAVPVFGCFPYDMRGKGDLWGYISLVNMAVACGMGKLGRNGLLINSSVGSRLLLGGIVTTARLPEESHKGNGDVGCPEGCTLCQDACPVKAIEPSGKVDRLKCIRHSMKSPLFIHLLKSGEVKESDAELVNHVSGVDDHSMYTCIACVAACPLG